MEPKSAVQTWAHDRGVPANQFDGALSEYTLEGARVKPEQETPDRTGQQSNAWREV
jgi:hypothetical protein